jgi:hypothetical protein
VVRVYDRIAAHIQGLHSGLQGRKCGHDVFSMPDFDQIELEPELAGGRPDLGNLQY